MYYTGDEDGKSRIARIHPSRFKLRQHLSSNLAALILRLLLHAFALYLQGKQLRGSPGDLPTDGLKACITRLRSGALDSGSAYSRTHIVHLVVQGGQLKKTPQPTVSKSVYYMIEIWGTGLWIDFIPSPNGSWPATRRLYSAVSLSSAQYT